MRSSRSSCHSNCSLHGSTTDAAEGHTHDGPNDGEEGTEGTVLEDEERTELEDDPDDGEEGTVEDPELGIVDPALVLAASSELSTTSKLFLSPLFGAEKI